jgi:hypothetical protein
VRIVGGHFLGHHLLVLLHFLAVRLDKKRKQTNNQPTNQKTTNKKQPTKSNQKQATNQPKTAQQAYRERVSLPDRGVVLVAVDGAFAEAHLVLSQRAGFVAEDVVNLKRE